ncbi:fatty acid desaturase [Synechococcus sp. EJ6-Ellesmere]|nr:fatty acid desaturase [Synechococcus sp. EJ6-Ellesmere]
MVCRNDVAAWQVTNTLVPYFLLWWLSLKAAAISLWLLPPLLVLLSFFSVGCFSLMHDCGHDVLFRSRRLNRACGFLFGLINAMPQLAWSRDHAFHHKTNGNWELYRGVADSHTVDEFLSSSGFQHKLYAGLRHPAMAIPGGFYYLAIKPRLDLLLGLTTRSTLKPWANKAEFNDFVLSNLITCAGALALGWWLGYGPFLGIYAAVLAMSAAIFIDIFFVQYIFEKSYARNSENWEYLDGALKGTSYLQLPAILRWFTADIGYHNIHHLSERIPNYQLRLCHERNQHLLADVPILKLSTMLECSKFLLWDPSVGHLVTIASLSDGRAAEVSRDSAQAVQQPRSAQGAGTEAGSAVPGSDG